VGAGFERPGEASQVVFRATLEAMAHPGKVMSVAQRAELPPGLGAAAGSVLLALLDHDTRLWTPASPHAGSIGAYLRFHTGCALAAFSDEAEFAFIGEPGALPSLGDFAPGTGAYPDRSTTAVVEVPALEGREWVLRGPGIEDHVRMAAAIPGPRFLAQWRAQRGRFPCGVDLLLTCGGRVAGLPRTVNIGEE
jgi:alpha-D-ribose 1-methylphosphonate 5-triphosphate synthase subunit PhnH